MQHDPRLTSPVMTDNVSGIYQRLRLVQKELLPGAVRLPRGKVLPLLQACHALPYFLHHTDPCTDRTAITTTP